MTKPYKFKPFEQAKLNSLREAARLGSMKSAINNLSMWINEPFIADESKAARIAEADRILAEMTAEVKE